MTRVRYGEVDPRCRALADAFLPPEADETTRRAMAQNLQDVVDDWLGEWDAISHDAPPTE
jgi:hypothetical protein